MQAFIQYIRRYVTGIHTVVLLLTIVITVVAVWINYSFKLNAAIYRLNELGEFVAWTVLFFVVFSLVYAVQAMVKKQQYFKDRSFVLLLFIAPVIFAWKMSADFHFTWSHNKLYNLYLNQVVYWPAKVIVITISLALIWKVAHPNDPFYGTVRQYKWKPYLLMLLLMVPMVAIASTQADFLATYPKFGKVKFLQGGEASFWHYLLFELGYGSDFFSIELFFRGFLVLAFARFAGKDAILPMAAFYCAIHFGKPLGECISSFFGGALLGIITYHTKSIWGGLMVHLGIAWLMELGGYLGRML